MAFCAECGTELGANQRFCASCGSKLDLSGLPTELDSSPVTTPGGAGDASAPQAGAPLVAGQLLDGRYRIVGLLGKGGMGEVYRADDLKLDQQVAIKFLSPRLAEQPQVRERFHQEVRTARRVSHPNVCRVHDIGEIDGRLYLTMEYIDGEDLASLIRRIGYLPRDKAVEIAQQLCGGLAAAHGQGMLHRDLKPANVMLDGQGRVKITDFGLAGFVGEIGDIRSGTPAYMSPEQLAGSEVTIRSDIYALGLVLYELFTGKPAFKAASAEELQTQQSAPPTTPSSHVEEIDPAVERIVMRCLERDPADRPTSALAVAVALPGGDPLAAALAAGETPSPEMVAAAGDEGTLAPWVAGALLGVCVAFVAALFFSFNTLQLPNQVDSPLSRQVLIDRARQILNPDDPNALPVDSIARFNYDPDRARYLAQMAPSVERYRAYARSVPSPIIFWYRQSDAPLNTRRGFPARAGWSDPPRRLAGMQGVFLDLAGRLLYLDRHPTQRDRDVVQNKPPDWDALFAAAGLERSEFVAVESTWVPPFHADLRRAWIGVHPESPDVELRIEAAGFGGEAVYFHLIWPWTTESRMPRASVSQLAQLITLTIVLATIAFAAFVAFRNARAGRGDRRGALHLAIASSLIFVAAWVLVDHHQASLSSLFGRFLSALGFGLAMATIVWTLYMAIEPAIRRRFPERIVGWTRLLAGRWRDPLVGRDILVGLAAGSAFAAARYIGASVAVAIGDPNIRPLMTWIDPFNGVASGFAVFLGNHAGAAVSALAIALIWFALRAMSLRVFRRAWPASLVLGGLLMLNIVSQFNSFTWISWSFSLFSAALLVYVIDRHGLLAIAVAMVYGNTLVGQTMPGSLSVWWSSGALIVYAAILALGVGAFWVAVGRRTRSGALI